MICWFTAQETSIIIMIIVENDCAAFFQGFFDKQK